MKALFLHARNPAAKRTLSSFISMKHVAKEVKQEVAQQVSVLRRKDRYVGLCVVMVGERKDSESYVRSKELACKEVGICSFRENLPASASEDEVLAVVYRANHDPKVNGILVQLPLPDHINEQNVIQSISPEKDVDGLTEVNQGRMLINGHKADLVPCTPKGCITLLDHYGVVIEGKKVVVLGRSLLVGKAVALLLLSRNATVTICHSKTVDLPDVVSQADIVIACMGKAQFVKGSWLKPGAVVVDVGINPLEDSSRPKGYRLVGDVDYSEAKQVASMITPVPGGVGPMTVATLLDNTLRAYRLQNNAP